MSMGTSLQATMFMFAASFVVANVAALLSSDIAIGMALGLVALGLCIVVGTLRGR